MYPEDRVLVAYMPKPADFSVVQTDGWYRIPQKHAPKGLHAEYFAFYFGSKFRVDKWAIHYYAPRLGHELMMRQELFPDQPDHARAQEMYYKVQLGPLQRLERPIVSLRWRRVTFLHTTWDRFQDATEINDLFIDGEPYVDRIYATLKERGIQAERNYRVQEPGAVYNLPLTIFCKNGRIDLTISEMAQNKDALDQFAARIAAQVVTQGGQ
ncbi:MAG: hypothetical protein GY805_02785 [Chloroflexi bacterium]|nr:hypothetical protein [Chloroflexota bacterium]